MFLYLFWRTIIMPDGSIPLLISIIILVFFSGFFSATETAFSCSSKIKLKSLFTNGNKRAGRVLKIAEEKYDQLISTILIGNNIVNLSASTISAILFAKLLANTHLNSSVISTAVITIAVLIFGEVTPKFVAKSNPEKFAMIVYPIIFILMYIFYPLNLLFTGWKLLIAKIFRFKSDEIITEDEIITMVEEAEDDGTIKHEETNLIRSVIEFDDLEVCDILVPRVNIAAVEKHAPFEEIRTTFENSGFSRLPVYNKDIDTIVGFIHEKDFYKLAYSEKSSIDSIIQKPYFATHHTKISKLLKAMQKEKKHMAIVLDEYGGTLGLVTMEDILEELVGEIYDEHDEQIEYIMPTGDDTYLVQGNTALNKLFKFFDMEEDEDSESNTVSGWIIEMLGEFPREGTKLTYGPLELEVGKIEERIIKNIKVTKLPEEEESKEEDDD